MSFSFSFATFKNWLTETEADVLHLITQIKADALIAERDIADALQWVVSNAPSIANDISQVTTAAEVIGVASNPEVAAAITAANLAVDGLNAFAAASKSGKNNLQAVVTGYAAVKQAQAAAASAAAATAVAPK